MIKFAILASVSASGTLPATTLTDGIQQTKPHMTYKLFNQIFSTGSIERIHIHVPAGTVRVQSDLQKQIEVCEMRTAKDPMTEGGRKWLDTSQLTAIPVGKELDVVDRPIPEAMKAPRTGLELVLHVPKGLAVEVEVGSGRVETTGAFRSIVSKVHSGNINVRLENCPAGKSSFELGTGQVKLELPREAAATVSGDVESGSIFGIPKDENSPMQVGDHRVGLVGSGKAQFKVHVGSGEFDVISYHALVALNHKTYRARYGTQIFHAPGTEQTDIYRDDQLMAVMPSAQFDDGGQDQSQQEKMQEKIQAEEMERANKEVEKAMKAARPEIERALAKIGPELKRKLAEIGPKIEKALREAGPQMDKERREHPEEFRREMAKARAEMKSEMAKAKIEMEKAMKEIDNKEMKQFDQDGKIRKIIQMAMEEAAKAMSEAAKTSEKALSDSKN